MCNFAGHILVQQNSYRPCVAEVDGGIAAVEQRRTIGSALSFRRASAISLGHRRQAYVISVHPSVVVAAHHFVVHSSRRVVENLPELLQNTPLSWRATSTRLSGMLP